MRPEVPSRHEQGDEPDEADGSQRNHSVGPDSRGHQDLLHRRRSSRESHALSGRPHSWQVIYSFFSIAIIQPFNQSIMILLDRTES